MEGVQTTGPIVLFVLMTVVGLELTTEDFRRVVAVPRAVLVGTLGQLLLLPLMTWGIVALSDAPPVIGAGAVLIAASPGAGASNLLAYLAGANTALSVTLTAVASLLSVVTLPLVTAIGLEKFLGGRVEIEVPVGMMMGQLFAMVILPIGVGMGVRARWPEFAGRHKQRVQRIGMLGIAIVVGVSVAFADEGSFRFEDIKGGVLAALLWTLAAMAIGWTLARLARLPPSDRFTFLIEFSTRNVALAAIVALSALQRPDLALFSGAYMTVGYPIAFAAVAWRRMRR